jgi:hypothetical protein
MKLKAIDRRDTKISCRHVTVIAERISLSS